jgi:hypothetical protein
LTGYVERLAAIAAVFSMAAMVGCEPGNSDVPSPWDREAATDPPDSNVWLVDVTATSGVDFIHTTGDTGELYILEVMGGGVAVFDADGDDRLDLYFINQNGLLPKLDPSTTDVNRLYRQTPDGRFVDVTEASGLGDGGYGMGVAIGDVDNDGDLDVYVSNYGADRLYLNDGRGVFEDATERSGITIEGLSASAAFFDYDRDDDLDLYVTQYVLWNETTKCTSRGGQRTFCGPASFRPVSDRLLRNEGGGRFVDVSEEAGIARVFAAGLGVVIEDFDQDGWLDAYVANDGYANNLWLNQRNGQFVDDALMLGTAYNEMGRSEAGMGVIAEDLDGDGWVDLFVTHLDEETNTLYRGLPDRTGFADATATAAPGQPSFHRTGFGVVAFDVELDGDLDLAVANGRVNLAVTAPVTHLPEPWGRLAEPNLFYLNRGDGVFELDTAKTRAFTEPVEISRGLVAADLDRDGDLDLVLANVQGAPRIFRNDAPREGAWLQVRAYDSRLKRDAVGARVAMETGQGTSWRAIRRAGSYLSSGPPIAQFTLPLEGGFRSLRVEWPDGLEESFPGGDGNRRVIVRRGEGRSE